MCMQHGGKCSPLTIGPMHLLEKTISKQVVCHTCGLHMQPNSIGVVATILELSELCCCTLDLTLAQSSQPLMTILAVACEFDWLARLGSLAFYVVECQAEAGSHSASRQVFCLASTCSMAAAWFLLHIVNACQLQTCCAACTLAPLQCSSTTCTGSICTPPTGICLPPWWQHLISKRIKGGGVQECSPVQRE